MHRNQYFCEDRVGQVGVSLNNSLHDGRKIATVTKGLDVKFRIWSTEPSPNAASENSGHPPESLHPEHVAHRRPGCVLLLMQLPHNEYKKIAPNCTIATCVN